MRRRVEATVSRAAKADTRAVQTTATNRARVRYTQRPTTFITPDDADDALSEEPETRGAPAHAVAAGVTTIQDAAYGFKNWGQFVAAAHVSNNLNIPFADLKARMTGIPPGTPPGTPVLTTPMSLGQAIQSFKGTKTMDTATFSSTRVRNEVKKAEEAANSDLRRQP